LNLMYVIPTRWLYFFPMNALKSLSPSQWSLLSPHSLFFTAFPSTSRCHSSMSPTTHSGVYCKKL
jgi:hypothetical protein